MAQKYQTSPTTVQKIPDDLKIQPQGLSFETPSINTFQSLLNIANPTSKLYFFKTKCTMKNFTATPNKGRLFPGESCKILMEFQSVKIKLQQNPVKDEQLLLSYRSVPNSMCWDSIDKIMSISDRSIIFNINVTFEDVVSLGCSSRDSPTPMNINSPKLPTKYPTRLELQLITKQFQELSDKNKELLQINENLNKRVELNPTETLQKTHTEDLNSLDSFKQLKETIDSSFTSIIRKLENMKVEIFKRIIQVERLFSQDFMNRKDHFAELSSIRSELVSLYEPRGDKFGILKDTEDFFEGYLDQITKENNPVPSYTFTFPSAVLIDKWIQFKIEYLHETN